MSDNPYQVLGVGIPPMLGRERLFERLRRHLTKPTPDHMCVVGPPLFGKSVLLNHLADHFKDAGDHYVTSLYWDLRHRTPMTDEEFRRRFAERIKAALQSVQSDLAEYLDPEDSEDLHIVFDEMQRKGLRFLAVLDGFDHLLAGSDITRNLWDEMRYLGQMTSLRFVTGSRRRLRELCMTEESRTSDFWEIFYDTPKEVRCFEERDWNGFLDPFKQRGVTFDSSARKEIVNWTGGVPMLAAALAGRLLAEAPKGTLLSKVHVDAIAKEVAKEKRDLLSALWDDCPIDLQSDLIALANGDIPISEVHDDRKRMLELRGFARESGKNLQASCRLMAEYAKQRAGGVENLRRLFGDAERFESNIQSLLDLRSDQIHGADPELMGYVKRAIELLQHEPIHSVKWVRSIAERALELIWDAELGPDRSLPERWKRAKVYFVEQKQDSQKQDPFPEESLGAQCGILRRSTDKKVLKIIKKPTQLLVDHLHSVGNFGQHMGRNTVSVPIAASFCLSAISLCESLAQDLAKSRDTETEE